ncbi:hypothetical protein FXB39_08355 [Nocardioides sp. BGMRC 2183]|nr:hypothetical protein FXB39_08355 [Nocardioides sp. BGMRC 2183]
MPFAVTAVVTVGDDPAPLDEDLPSVRVVFPIADAQFGLYPSAAGEEVVPIEHFDVGEVVCDGPLGHMAQAQLRAGDHIIVTGTLELRASLRMDRDSAYVLMAIRADQIGRMLSSHACDSCAPR